jgi:hypothetical protein
MCQESEADCSEPSNPEKNPFTTKDAKVHEGNRPIEDLRDTSWLRALVTG